jgi:Helix-turn-helix domain
MDCAKISSSMEERQNMIRYLSTADASRVLVVTPATVRLMAKRGELPIAGITEGGIQLFRRSEVERLAKSREKRREQAVAE